MPRDVCHCFTEPFIFAFVVQLQLNQLSACHTTANSNTKWSVASSSRKGAPYLGIVSNQECNHHGDACASLSGIRLSLSSSTKVTSYFVQICHDCG